MHASDPVFEVRSKLWSRRRGRRAAALVLALWPASADGARDSCGEWTPHLFATNGLDNSAFALRVIDDGGGPALFVGGAFTRAGGQAVNHVARFDGTAWTAVGSGVNREVDSLLAFDDGGGLALYAGGGFDEAGGAAASRIARWNGRAWSAVGAGMSAGPFDFVNALAQFDDGAGPALFAAGRFTHAGGGLASNIARWSGTEWSPLGEGLDGTVWALAVFDDGSGEALYAAGLFGAAGGAAASRIARWDGRTWSAVGGGASDTVYALAVFDDGGGPALYAGGTFTTAGGVHANRIARWDGSTWSPLGAGTDGAVFALAVFDDGTGPALYAGGSFTSAGGVPAARVARWNGAEWSALGAGLDGFAWDLAAFTDSRGRALYAAGGFTTAGGTPSSFIARFDPAPRRGNVGSSTGAASDVLFLNGSAGGEARVVTLAAGEPIEVELRAAPSGPEPGRYVLWIWVGEPARAVEIERMGTPVGCTVNPTPVHVGLRPQPALCLRGARVPPEACAGVPEREGASGAPWILRRGRGLEAPLTLTMQGLLRDRTAASGAGFSVTNAIVLRVR
jgi:hypothetical protein